MGLWIVENGEAYDSTNEITRDISHTAAVGGVRRISRGPNSGTGVM